MNIKQAINNPKLWQALTTILTAVLGYFGYVQVSENNAPDVNIEVTAPATEHTHKNWNKDISEAVEKSMNAHNDRFH